MDTNIFLMLARYSQGNPGAMQFLVELFSDENMLYAIPIGTAIHAIPSLRGTNLYVLWSDLCYKDMATVSKLCKNCPHDILADACSRQDYSGRELVKNYI